MAIFGLFTNLGISKTIDADNNEGFYVHPLTFGVSDVAGSLDPSRTGPNAGQWYTAPISSRVVVNNNTVKFICTIPQNAVLTAKNIEEVYLYAEDSMNVSFLLALGQPSENLIYDPSGTVTLELQVSLIDIDLTANYLFTNTQATELAEHETDPNAHPEIKDEMAKAGIFIEGGSIPFDFVGQQFEDDAEFAGTPAQATSGGVTFTAQFNGTEGNSISLVFDGIDDVDTVTQDWNDANPNNMVEHNGIGTEVLTAQTVNLVGGTYLVNEDDVVYRDTDGLFKQALADGTIKTKAVGIALRSKRRVVYGGLHSITTGYAVATVLYLSSTSAGDFSNINNGVSLGIVLKSNLILFTGFSGATDANVSETFDAVVSDLSGINFYPTTQQAINAVATNSRILIDKVEDVEATITTGGKTLDMVFAGPDKGWRKKVGVPASFKVEFSTVPTQGTWRIEWNGQESIDLAYNANAAAVQAAFNLFYGHDGVVVTGNYSIGFTFTFTNNEPQPLPTFLFAGLNEIQRFNFSNVPNNGTIKFEFEGQQTLNFPWDDSAADLEIALEALSTINNVTVTGSFAANYFQIEFVTNFFSDGLQPQGNITVVASTLQQGITTTLVNTIDPSVPMNLPINPVIIQQGKYPASNLYDGSNAPIAISTSVLQVGESDGPDKCIILTGSDIRITGYGTVEDFAVGIDVNNQLNSVIALRFDNVTLPISSSNRLPGVNHLNHDTIGYALDIFSQLKINEHPTNKKRVKISGAEQLLANGAYISQEINSLLLKFEGAEIDFDTGNVYENDGITALGLNFTMPTIASSQWRWFSINIVPQSVQGDLSLKGQVLVLPASADGASMVAAPKAPFGKPKPIGMVACQGTFALPEISDIKTTADSGGSLHLKGFRLYEDATDDVAVFYDIGNTGDPAPAWALAATRYLRITAVNANDSALITAQELKNILDADAQFSAVVSGNRVTSTNIFLGNVPDIVDNNSGFYFNVVQQGKNLDASGIEDISNTNIKQLGVGSGSGGGASSSILGRLEDYLDDSVYSYLTYNVFELDLDAKVGVGSTGAFSYATNTYDLSNTQILYSESALDSEFLTDLKDVDQIDFVIVYDSDSIDTNPAVAASRNGGSEYQTMTMERITDNTYVGSHTFSEEATPSTLYQYNVSNADALEVIDATTNRERAQQFTTSADPKAITDITMYVNKLGSPTGYIYFNIYNNNAGNPGDIIFQQAFNIASLSAGNNTLSIPVSRKILELSTIYHLGFSTDATYKSSYSAGVNEIAVRVDNSAPTIPVSKTFNGTTWSSDTSSFVYLVEGHAIDLKLRLTASMSSKVSAIGIYYDTEFRQAVRNKRRASFVFHGTNDNLNTFALPSSFVPDSDFLSVKDVFVGQEFMVPAFELQGQNIVFPTNFFNGRDVVHLIAIQHDSDMGDAAQDNRLLLQENHLGSNDATLDKSVAGRGIKLRNGAGVLVELTINSDNSIEIIGT
jgi:hypothetical protein